MGFKIPHTKRDRYRKLSVNALVLSDAHATKKSFPEKHPLWDLPGKQPLGELPREALHRRTSEGSTS